MKKLIPVTIRKKKWLRGAGGNSLLLNTRGSKCCLGFVCTAMGVKARDMMDKSTPGELLQYIPGLTRKSDNLHCDTNLCDTAMGINDDGEYTSVERETKLKKIANRMGYKFTFV
jgi:hypothetical protein